MKTEDWALIISIISFIVSLVALYQDRKLNCVNLQADYYKKIFEEYLLKDIPIAVRLIEFNNEGKLTKDYKELNKILLRMLEDCTYFAYANNNFYEKLSMRIINIDEKLIETASVAIINEREQAAFIFNIHQEMQSMIKLINKSYMS